MMLRREPLRRGLFGSTIGSSGSDVEVAGGGGTAPGARRPTSDGVAHGVKP